MEAIEGIDIQTRKQLPSGELFEDTRITGKYAEAAAIIDASQWLTIACEEGLGQVMNAKHHPIDLLGHPDTSAAWAQSGWSGDSAVFDLDESVSACCLSITLGPDGEWALTHRKKDNLLWLSQIPWLQAILSQQRLALIAPSVEIAADPSAMRYFEGGQLPQWAVTIPVGQHIADLLLNAQHLVTGIHTHPRSPDARTSIHIESINPEQRIPLDHRMHVRYNYRETTKAKKEAGRLGKWLKR